MTDPKFSIQLMTGDPHDIKSPVHFKAAASWATRLVREHVRYDRRGQPYYPTILIIDEHKFPVADSRHGTFDYCTAYPAVRYILAAIRNEKQRLATEAEEWLTPSEIETQLDIRAGTVRQYIRNHRDTLLSYGTLKEADGRTIMMRRGQAYNIWQTCRATNFVDTVDYARIVDITSDEPVLWHRAPLRPELYDALRQSVWATVWMEGDQPYIHVRRYNEKYDIDAALYGLKESGYVWPDENGMA